MTFRSLDNSVINLVFMRLSIGIRSIFVYPYWSIPFHVNDVIMTRLLFCFSLGLDPASLAAGLFSTGAYGNPATGHASPVAAANPLANPTSALTALYPGLTNQMLAQLLAANPVNTCATSLSLANFSSPSAAVAASLAPSSVGSMSNLVNCQPGNQSPSSNNFAAAMTGTSLVNVIRPNFTNLKKARSEAAPY